MNENFEELDARLQKADPALDSVEIGQDVLIRATNSKAKKPKSLALKLSGSFAGLAAATAIAVAVTAPAQPLFELVGSNAQVTGAENDMKVGGSSAMMTFIQYEFVAGADLSNSEASGQVYQIVASQNMAARMASLASYFEITGDAVSQPDFPHDFVVGGNAKGEYVAGAAMLYYSTSTGSWSYNNDLAWGVTTTCDANKVCTQEKSAPGTSVPMPSKAQAIAKAEEIFNAACGFAGQVRYEYFTDPSYAYINAYLQVDGIDTVQYTVSWSSTGQVAGAYGYCVDVKNKGNFSTVSPAKAVERLNDYRWSAGLPASYYAEPQFWGGVRMGVLTDDMAVGSGEASSSEGSVDPAEPTAAPTAEPATEPTAEPTVEPAPAESITPEPLPTPTLTQVEIVKSKLTMVMVWDSNGSVWLVPGWALYADQGLVGGVIALHDGVIKLPEAMPMVK
ncbi:MAG: PT domain-containing protein [Micrococcales bacterium]